MDKIEEYNKDDELNHCFEQYELRFDHYITDMCGKKIRLEEPLVVKTVVNNLANGYSPQVKNHVIEEMFWKLRYYILEEGGE